jgi:hypothetical protein
VGTHRRSALRGTAARSPRALPPTAPASLEAARRRGS